MEALFSLMILFIIIILCIIVLFGVYLLLVSLLYKKKSKLLKFILSASLSVVTTFLIFGILAWYSFGYWNDSGWADSYRVPLEKPYHLIMIDQPNNGSIDIWDEDSKRDNPNISGIDSLNKFNNYVVGYNRQYFIFNCSSGKTGRFYTESLYRDWLDSLHIDRDIKLMSTEDYYHAYWREH